MAIAEETKRRTHFVHDLYCFGSQTALVDAEGPLTYVELDRAVEERAKQLGPDRTLVLVAATNQREPLITYLAALRGRHPVMLVDPKTSADALIEQFRPGIAHVRDPRSDGWHLTRVSDPAPPHTPDFHDDLALLLSTSGSTGSAKLVRLSRDNLDANAASIAQYLGLTAADRVMTSLPLHYCYGLSVVHSHLLVGGTIILTDRSVTDPIFWDTMREHEATSFPAVPFTFDLLDRIGFESMHVPSLRYLTQAGGRLAPEVVRRYAELGAARGFDLFVMYGQTEATARMGFVPPSEVAAHPDVIGGPIPGGSFRIDAPDDTGVGELVYAGPNVMMGYASSPADLARGPELHELRTGDLARYTPTGHVQIAGRASRFLKLFGLRIDLDTVESVLGAAGIAAVATGDDNGMVVALTSAGAAERTADLCTTRFGLTPSSTTVVVYDDIPLLGSGKPDYVAIRRRARDVRKQASEPASGGEGMIDSTEALLRAFARLLAVDEIGPEDTFVSLGGDSLSYIEASLVLEDTIGHLPDQWHETPIVDLAASEAPSARSRRPRWFTTIETNVVLRALAIACVLVSHFGILEIQGGAHVLLALAGYNFSRFVLANVMRSDSAAPIRESLTKILLPVLVWSVMVGVARGEQRASELLLVSNFDPGRSGGFWFLEVLIQMLVVLFAVVAIPSVRSLHRRSPYQFAVGVVVLSLALRYGIHAVWDTTHLGFKVPHMAFWLFALGWLADRSDTVRRRVGVSVVALATIPGFFDSVTRTLVMLGGVLVLIWVPTIRVPRATRKAFGLVGTASMYLYLTHFQVSTLLGLDQPYAKLAAALVFGVVASQAADRWFQWAEKVTLSRPVESDATPERDIVLTR